MSDGLSSIFYDGVTSRRRLVDLTFGPRLQISESGGVVADWAWSNVRPLRRRGRLLRITATTAPAGARLDVADDALKREIASRCDLFAHRPRRDRIFLLKAGVLSAAALASVGSLLWFGIPYAADRITPLVPYALEEKVGGAAEAQLRSAFPGELCTGEAGRAALDKLMSALISKANLLHPVRTEVVKTDVANAIALPGGRVFVLQGILEQSNTPDELAGVLAHELGHLLHRDGMRKLIAEGSTAYFIGLMFGDVTGAGALLFATKSLLGAAHSREAETRADATATVVMNALGRPTKPLGELLIRMGGKEDAPAILAIIQDHPLNASRLIELTRADQGERGPPLLTDAEWQALKKVCK